MRQLPFMGFVCTVMLFVVYRTTKYQHRHTEVMECIYSRCFLDFAGTLKIESTLYPFYTSKEYGDAINLKGLPHGIIQARSDLELKPLWSKSRVNTSVSHNLLAIPAGVKQKSNVNAIVQKFLAENFTVMLFHYDSNVNGWSDFDWSKKAIHVAAHNQTKWWFAKRFLHPAIVSIYDYIFLWDEDLGVENFHPRRYLDIVKAEGFEISQPALDPNSTGIHHRITIRLRTNKFHRRVWDDRGNAKCSESSEGPPCTGFVEGMAPVFSRPAWQCAWHLIQNDLVHGWGMDMKLGYCAQGDRTKKVGVVDSEYVVHQAIQTLGGLSLKKDPNAEETGTKKHVVDVRAEIRRQSTIELQIFKDRWERAVKEDKIWIDPYNRRRKRKQRLHKKA